MKRRYASALLAAAVLLSAAGCAQERTPQYQATFLGLFDTVTTIVGYGGTREEFEATAQWLHDALEEYHRLYDIYNAYSGVSNLKTINDHPGEAVEVDRRIIDLLLEAKEINTLTGGRVNPAMGSVLSLWHTYRAQGIDRPEEAGLPPMSALLAAAEHTDIDKVVIDEAASTVRLADPKLSLDVGAIAKGYAAQRVCEAAEEAGLSGLLLSVGGNVCAVGVRPDGKDWRVSIQDPEDSTGSLHVLALVEQTLVTSGGYQRYYTVNGTRYHHIIDPDTLMPAAYVSAVSVLAEDSGRADALSTALFNLPYEAGAALVERLDGVEALWVFHNGEERMSAGFEAAILN